MLDLISEIIQTLRNNKLRTSLTGFAVAWGIFMLIVLLGMSRGVINAFNEGRMSQGSNSVSIFGGMTAQPYKGYKEGRDIQLKTNDIATIESENRQNVSGAASSISGAAVISSPHDYISKSYRGVYPRELADRGEKIIAGRFINEMDMAQKRKVMVMTIKNAAVLFPDTTKIIGKKVTCKGLSFTVIGLIDPEFGEDTYIPFTTAMMLEGGKNNVSEIKVNLTDVKTLEDGEKAEKELRETLSRIHEFSPDDQSAIWIWNRFTQHIKMSSAMDILEMVIWIIGIFTMLSGIVGVSNIMFVSVRERTHEIGIRRAIGAKPKNILTQILTESIAITTLFGYIGIFFGILVTQTLNLIFGDSEFIKDSTVDISIAIKVTVVLIIAGAAAGLFPALKALKVKPVEALRDE